MQQINTALCSFGMSGSVFHAPFISAHPGFNLVAVWERSSKQAAKKYPGINSFDTLEQMLGDESIDLVVINTPNYTHFEFAKKALQANKHVIVEKSFTVSVAEAEELELISRQVKKVITVFQNRRYDSDFKTIKNIKDIGVLGKIVEVDFHFDRFNMSLSKKVHKELDEPGSGLLHDLGPHLIDQALFLFGMPGSVFASLRITRAGSIVNDYFDIMLFYPGPTVRLKSGFIVKEGQPAYIMHGTNGSILKPRGDVQEDNLKAGRMPGTAGWGKELSTTNGVLTLDEDGETIRKEIIAVDGNYMEIYEGIYQAIVTGVLAPVTAADGINVMKIIEAVQLSNIEKRVIGIVA